MTDRLKILSLKAENIQGMTMNLEFKSNLVILYGYNRTGKTNLINCLQYAFRGVQSQKIDLKFILGGASHGSIELIFAFNGILYKIVRSFTSQDEKLTLLKSHKNLEGYQSLILSKKGNAWSSSSSEALINNEPIKTKGSSVQLLDQALERVKLYPIIINRLIATENVQEFKKAAETLCSNDGGYSAIKHLLFREMQEKSESINNILKYCKQTQSQLEIQSQKLNKEHRALIAELETFVNSADIIERSKNEFIKLVNLLALNDNFETALQNLMTILENTATEAEKKFKDASARYVSLDNREIKYTELEKLLGLIQLTQIESVIQKFRADYDVIHQIYNDISKQQRKIEEIQTVSPSEKIEINFSYLTDPKIISKIKSAHLSSSLDSSFIKSIPIQINEVITKFHKGLSTCANYNRLISEYHIRPNNVENVLLAYKEQLAHVKNPSVLSSDDKIYQVLGQVESDPLSKTQVLRIYMPIEDLNRYISDRNPIQIASSLMPIATSKDQTIAQETISKLAIQIQHEIENLNTIQNIRDQLPNIKIEIKTCVEDLEKINSELDSVRINIDKWEEFIKEKKALARNFIEQNSQTKVKESTNLQQELIKIQQNFISELTTDFVHFELGYRDQDSLKLNLDSLRTYLGDLKSETETYLNLNKEISKQISDKKERYKTLCNDYELAKDLKEKMLPVIISICQQMESNIKLDQFEQTVMDSITTSRSGGI